MTPSEILTQMRLEYNAVGDSFWSDAELLNLLYQGSMELATKSLCIERVFTTTTVADQREYAMPDKAISIKVMTYDNEILRPMTPEEDLLFDGDFSISVTGTVAYYAFYNEVIYLRPTPSEAKELKIYAAVEPQTVTATSTLDIPSRYHPDLINFGLSKMIAKDKDYQAAQVYENKWARAVAAAERFEARRKRGQRTARVKQRWIRGRFD